MSTASKAGAPPLSPAVVPTGDSTTTSELMETTKLRGDRRFEAKNPIDEVHLKSDDEEDDEFDSDAEDVEDDVEEEDGANDMDTEENEGEQQEVTEELVPVRIEMKSGEWEFRDQFVWPVTLPLDILGNRCSEYVEYNLQDPRIDAFSLRTVEDLDFPVGFDVFLSKSIRAQLMLTIPVIWKERQQNALLEKRKDNSSQHSHTVLHPSVNKPSSKTGHSDATSNHVDERVPENAIMDEEKMIEAITSTNVFPANAVRRLLKGPAKEDEENQETSGQGEQEEILDYEEDDAVAEFTKKRKRMEVGEGTGRWKRKKGTAFEAHTHVDERITIKLNLAINGVNLQDQFEWDPSTPLFWSDIFARRLATELGLPREMEIAIAFEIRRQVLAYLASCSHHLPLDWSSTRSSLAAVAASSSSSSTTSSKTGTSKPSTHTASSSAGNASLSSSSQLTTGDQSYIPTRSLPILSLRSVIRPHQVSDSYGPSLTFHQPSHSRWERDISHQRRAAAQPASNASNTTTQIASKLAPQTVSSHSQSYQQRPNPSR